jgi:hypothetical protein
LSHKIAELEHAAGLASGDFVTGWPAEAGIGIGSSLAAAGVSANNSRSWSIWR